MRHLSFALLIAGCVTETGTGSDGLSAPFEIEAVGCICTPELAECECQPSCGPAYDGTQTDCVPPDLGDPLPQADDPYAGAEGGPPVEPSAEGDAGVPDPYAPS